MLPFNAEEIEQFLGSSRNSAFIRLQHMEKKFRTNPEFHQRYTDFMNEYENLGHMTLDPTNSTDGYVTPHHAVLRESSSTTKLRVVFDASCETSNGFSLNDRQLAGPTLHFFQFFAGANQPNSSENSPPNVVHLTAVNAVRHRNE